MARTLVARSTYFRREEADCESHAKSNSLVSDTRRVRVLWGNSSFVMLMIVSFQIAFALVLSLLAAVGVIVHAGHSALLSIWTVTTLVMCVLLLRVVYVAKLKLSPRLTKSIVLPLIAGLTVLTGVLFVLANRKLIPGQIDRDDLIIGGLQYLFSGRNPYLFQLSQSQPISVFPGWLLLNVPFFLLGKLTPGNALYAAQNIAAYGIAYVLWRAAFRISKRDFLVFLILQLPALPTLAHEVIGGGDHLANCVLVVAMAACAVSSNWDAAKRPLFLALFGMVLLSRANFILVLAPVMAFYLARCGWKETIRRSCWIILPATMLALVFWVCDPVHFMPLHTYTYLGHYDDTSRLDAQIRYSTSLAFGLALTGAVTLACALAAYRRPVGDVVLQANVYITAVPVIYAFASNSIQRGEIYIGPFSNHILAAAIAMAAAVVLAGKGGVQAATSEGASAAPVGKPRQVSAVDTILNSAGNLIRYYANKQFVWFCLFGGMAAAVSLAVAYCLYRDGNGLSLPYWLCVLLASFAGLVVNFSLNYLFNFAFRGRAMIAQFGTFCTVAGFGMVLTALLSSIGLFLLEAGDVKALHLGKELALPNKLLANVVAVGLVTFYSYAAHRFFSFNVGVLARLRRHLIEGKT